MAGPTTYRLELAYDGAAFAGYARQPGLVTVEACLLEAAGRVAGEAPRIVVAGRTDRGVSATGQVISFRAPRPLDLQALVASIDAVHPGLTTTDARVVPRWFHAQFSAQARHYVYFAPDPGPELADRVDRLLGALLGRRCFSAFARDTPPGKTTERTLLRASARRVMHEGRLALRIDLMADAFLRKQVRVLVTTALREAAADAPEDALVTLAATGDRRRAAFPAPAEGLTLARVLYEPHLPVAAARRAC